MAEAQIPISAADRASVMVPAHSMLGRNYHFLPSTLDSNRINFNLIAELPYGIKDLSFMNGTLNWTLNNYSIAMDVH